MARSRVYFLSRNPGLSPWAELGLEGPDFAEISGIDLLRMHEWSPAGESEPRAAILVDIDAIRATQPFDDWALDAWKSSLGDLVARMTNPGGSGPSVLAYTREPSWDSAVAALRVGARDISRMSRLSDRLRETLRKREAPKPATFPPPLAAEKAPEEAPTNVVPFRKVTARGPEWAVAKSFADEGGSAPEGLGAASQPAIPKHAIPFPIEGLEGTSAAVEALRTLIRRSAPLETSVLVTGPTGSGKDLVARALHRHSPRASGPFVSLPCAALVGGLIESELFGHVKGAFTGAVLDRRGYLESASGGTLFLDEVAALPLEAQAKLLRALQEREITPVGASRAVPIDIRLVAASQEDLEEKVREGRFREDFFYRLKVVEIELPALKERKADIPEIARTTLKKLARRNRRFVPSLSEDVVEKFLLHSWPGNIRELENVLEHGATLCWAEGREKMGVEDLPESVRFAAMSVLQEGQLKEVVRRFEREYIASTIRRLGGSKEHAAEALGLSLATLYRKLGS
jgi:DNA-binding NtrC family response regulator